MKKIDLGQTISILANVGVIAGIVFLGYELRQNNQLLEAAQRESRSQRLLSLTADLYGSSDLSDILVRARSGEPISEAERLRVHSLQMRSFRGFEAQYREYVAGTTEFLPLEVFRNVFFRGGLYGVPMAEGWEASKPFFSEDFVQFMEERIIAQGPVE